MKIIMVICVAVLFVGCANILEVKCPSCDITSNDGNTSVSCTECTIEGKVSEDFEFFTLPGRG